MTHRIEKVNSVENFMVLVTFQNGVEKMYDLKPIIAKFPQFLELKNKKSLFEKVRVDVGGCGIVWNDRLDLAADEIWHNGCDTGRKVEMDCLTKLGADFTSARSASGITQKELAKKIGIHQGDISKIERGNANPSVQTLQRLARGIGMRLKIEFVPPSE